MAERRSGLRVLAILQAVVCVLLASDASLGAGDKKDEKKKGWLEGTTVSEDGKVLTLAIRVYQNGKLLPYAKDFEMQSSDLGNGGFYSRELDPGVYEVRIRNEPGSSTNPGFRPQRYLGVEIKPGVRTVLKVK